MRIINDLYILLNELHDKEWDWRFMPSSMIDMSIVQAHPSWPWHWSTLSMRIYLEYDRMIEMQTMEWNWKNLSANPTLSWKLIKALPETSWSWKNISKHHVVTLDILDEHPDAPWKWKYVSDNPNLTLKYILANVDKDWNWARLSSNLTISLATIEITRALPWDWFEVYVRSDVTRDFIERNFSAHPCVMWEHLHATTICDILRAEDHMMIEMFTQNTWIKLSVAQIIPWEVLSAYLDKPLQWITLSEIAPLDIIEKHNEWPWVDEGLSRNKNMTMEFINAHPNVNWNWSSISCCPNIDLDLIKDKFSASAYLHARVMAHPNTIRYKDILAAPDEHWAWHFIPLYQYGHKISLPIRRVIAKFCNKIKARIQRRKRLFAPCLIELTHLPGLGIEYYKIKASIDALIDEMECASN